MNKIKKNEKKISQNNNHITLEKDDPKGKGHYHSGNRRKKRELQKAKTLEGHF